VTSTAKKKRNNKGMKKKMIVHVSKEDILFNIDQSTSTVLNKQEKRKKGRIN